MEEFNLNEEEWLHVLEKEYDEVLASMGIYRGHKDPHQADHECPADWNDRWGNDNYWED